MRLIALFFGLVAGLGRPRKVPPAFLDNRTAVVQPIDIPHSLVKNQEPIGDHADWGYPVYPEDQWKNKGLLGETCTPLNPSKKCGTQLVCRNEECDYCRENTECSAMLACHSTGVDKVSLCMPRQLSWNILDFWCMFIVFLAASLSAAAGVGGGAIYVPVFLLMLHMAPTDAVPLSQVVIMITSAINVVTFMGQKHPDGDDWSKVDFDICVELIGGMVYGTVLGVILNQICPHWLLTLFLLIVLIVASWRTTDKGLKAWRKESANVFEVMSDRDRGSFFGNFKDNVTRNAWQLIVIGVVWIIAFSWSLIDICPCTTTFAMILVGFGVVLFSVAIGASTAVHFLRENPPSWYSARPEDSTARTKSDSAMHIFLSLVTGVLGGMLGIGGGIIMAPILLELKLHSEVVQATTALLVFFSASMASLQFITMERVLWEYVALYGLVAATGTLVGQTVIEMLVRKTRRFSFIVLAIALMLGISLLVTAAVGSLRFYEDLIHGDYLGFNPERLCRHCSG